jgi:dTDP-4-dehydrorhamnose reductase
MDKLFIVGGNTIAGANIATTLADPFDVLVSDSDANGTSLQQAIQIQRPNWVIFCGQASRSGWDVSASAKLIKDDLASVCAKTCDQLEITFTMLSSDAIFTGPWMSHDEECTQFCETPQARSIREAEDRVFENCPHAMIIRANVFGCGPSDDAGGFAEEMAECLAGQTELTLDFVRHASPILASDLAELLVSCFDEEVQGVLHLGTAERTSPFHFAAELANALDLPQPVMPHEKTLNRTAQGFGQGETTLDCTLACNLLGSKMPLLKDCLPRFAEQLQNGYQHQLRESGKDVSRVA